MKTLKIPRNTDAEIAAAFRRHYGKDVGAIGTFYSEAGEVFVVDRWDLFDENGKLVDIGAWNDGKVIEAFKAFEESK